MDWCIHYMWLQTGLVDALIVYVYVDFIVNRMYIAFIGFSTLPWKHAGVMFMVVCYTWT